LFNVALLFMAEAVVISFFSIPLNSVNCSIKNVF
jgi:hypothetical protein